MCINIKDKLLLKYLKLFLKLITRIHHHIYIENVIGIHEYNTRGKEDYRHQNKYKFQIYLKKIFYEDKINKVIARCTIKKIFISSNILATLL